MNEWMNEYNNIVFMLYWKFMKIVVQWPMHSHSLMSISKHIYVEWITTSSQINMKHLYSFKTYFYAFVLFTYIYALNFMFLLFRYDNLMFSYTISFPRIFIWWAVKFITKQQNSQSRIHFTVFIIICSCWIGYGYLELCIVSHSCN